MSERSYLAEGSRPEMARLQAALAAAGIASEVGAPPAGCAPST